MGDRQPLDIVAPTLGFPYSCHDKRNTPPHILARACLACSDACAFGMRTADGVVDEAAAKDLDSHGDGMRSIKRRGCPPLFPASLCPTASQPVAGSGVMVTDLSIELPLWGSIADARQGPRYATFVFDD